MEKGQLNKEETLSIHGLSDELCIFNGFQFPLLPGMSYMMDGKPGQRTLFISDMNEDIVISLEQGMKCLDLTIAKREVTACVHCEYRQDNKYLHQMKLLSGDKVFKNQVYFHMEVTDDDGTVHICPGQMILSADFEQAEEMEPILIKLLNGFAVYKMKGGG